MATFRTALAGCSVVVTALAFAACNTAMLNQQSEEQTIRSLDNDWQRAIVSHDVERIVSHHSPDALVMFSNNPLATGSSQIRDAYTRLVNIPGVSSTWQPTRIEIVSPTVATVLGTFTFAYDGAKGRVTQTGNYITIWRKIDGQWHVAVDAPVLTTPMPAPCPTATP